jgi:uncharacterized membrane-anchored protein YitT (DUF2179 family)
MNKKIISEDIKHLLMVLLGSALIAWDIKTFVNAAGLLPGGFNGLTLLIQECARTFAGVEVPYTVINLLLNSVPAVISFIFIGKKFTVYSVVAILTTSFLVDLIPMAPMTEEVMLNAIFGGIINGVAVTICLRANATTGGTDFISIFVSERYGIDAWNYIMMGNICILLVAGALFGWTKAMYSIIFQYVSTQVLQGLYKRYQKQTLFIITEAPGEVYQVIRDNTNHDATLFKGIGLYLYATRNLVYSVISRDEAPKILRLIREVDPKAFINVVNTEQVTGKFYQRPR